MSDKNAETTYKRGRVITAASDGACSGNPGPGGWGALIRFENGAVEEFGGAEPETTNNRMELKAVLETLIYLKNLPLHPNLTIKTDSKYLINGFCHWIIGWKQNGWRTASGKSVLNQDLWQSLDHARLKNVSLEFVKGHSGDKDNERVDQIAVSYSKGTYIKLNSAQKESSIYKIKNPTEANTLNQPGPRSLQQLITRLDMANHIATHGYSLSINELAELLEIPATELAKRQHSWQWRDWRLEPIGDCKWRIKLPQQKKSTSREEDKDG